MVRSLPQRIGNWAQWIASHELPVLIALLAIVVSLWIFVEVADEVYEGETHHYDLEAIRLLRQADDPAMPIGPRWVHEAGRDFTALGGVAVLTLVTLSVTGFLLLTRNWRAAWFVLAATAGGFVVSMLLKMIFARERPDVVPHLSIVSSYSFPSGHAMQAAVVYLTLGTLLSRLVEGYALKVYFLAVALLLTFVVGVSRVYLGVHYPTDVLAGWSAGLAWAAFCWLIARFLQRKGRVEQHIEIRA